MIVRNLADARRGEVETRSDGNRHAIAPGTIYILDHHDEQVLRARAELTMTCVFNPPLNGREVHDASGAYPVDGEAMGEAKALEA